MEHERNTYSFFVQSFDNNPLIRVLMKGSIGEDGLGTEEHLLIRNPR